MRQAARRSVASGRSGAAVCLSREHVKRVVAPASARCICTSATISSSGDSNVRQYVSLYNYTDVDATELPYLRRRVLAAWREMHVTGRVYLAEEGINAQLTLPENRLQAFATSFPRLFGPEHMYLGARISDDTAHSSPFKALSEHPDEPSLFKGKNFVFDQRCVAGAVGGAGAESEVLTEDVLGTCFQCGEPCNDHTNCSNLMCGGLILLCPACRVALLGACSDACREEVKKMRDMTGPALRTYRKQHASKWHYNVPNALSRLQYRASARGFSSSAIDSSSSDDRLDLNTYVFQMSSPLEDEALLQELRDATQREWPKSEQLIDAPQGKALGSLVALVGAKHVLEVGCFTGYSAMCLASGLPKGDSASSVTTCDIDKATMAFAKDFFTRSSRREQLHAVVSDGLEFLDQCSATGRTFDLIFVDANKRQYRNYFDLILEKRLLRPNGLLVFDNTLFRGRVLAHVNGDAHKKERIARGLADFNAHVASDPRVTSVLLPLWDGLTLVRWASSSAQPDNA
ncbi:hypothetical protein P43SY_008835 [Pythium insidiosum]|uniref:Rhodanese domain-containing protein n=1 Tax=Pythium insidiosum TaxID=114742 RepID=A0AAD5M6W2_PYTIN|nr:hypothetical protein P43SY_008835 [Pythium insidiosum]